MYPENIEPFTVVAGIDTTDERQVARVGEKTEEENINTTSTRWVALLGYRITRILMGRLYEVKHKRTR